MNSRVKLSVKPTPWLALGMKADVTYFCAVNHSTKPKCAMSDECLSRSIIHCASPVAFAAFCCLSRGLGGFLQHLHGEECAARQNCVYVCLAPAIVPAATAFVT